MTRRTGPRLLTTMGIVGMVLAVIGIIASIMLNAFVFDEYDAYGEIPIPGYSSLHLPDGNVTVTFQTVLVGGSGSGLPVPPLKYVITAPDGTDLKLTENYGSTTTVNNDARVRIGYLHIPTEGNYDIKLDGNVSAYLNPALAFGHGSSYGFLPWVFAVVFALGALGVSVGRFWSRVGRSQPVPNFPPPPTGFRILGGGDSPPPPPPPSSFAPSEEGIRVQELNTLARLRDSGALTEDEYQAEKKRVLDGL